MVSKCSLDLFLLMIFVLDPTFVFETVIAFMEQILTAELSDIFTASGRM